MSEEFIVEENAGAPAENTAPESATGEQQESQPELTSKPEGDGNLQKRFRELTEARRRAEEDAEYWREQARKVAPTETPKEDPKLEVDAKPKADAFENHEDFVEALTDWKIEQREKTRTQQTNTERLRIEQQEVASTFEKRENEFRAKAPDYDELMAGPEIKVSASLVQEVLNHENGPELKYWLLKNPAEAARLSALTPLKLAREIGRLEPRFTAPAEGKQAPVTRVSPAPITPISGSRSVASDSLDTDDYAEYERRRNAQMKR